LTVERGRLASESVERVDLVPLTPDDEWLTAALETDPEVMRDLGGPLDPAEVPELHARRVEGIEAGNTWYFTIHLESDGPPVGTICLWDDDHHDQRGGSEAGWMVLPGYQGRGIARAAVRQLIELARADGRWGDIHAYPNVMNVASNALARATGFTLVGTVDVEFRGHRLRCNDWVLRTTEPGAGS
jgi:RimJ/RimL family protein N-acetyltransferase